jgi:CDP-glucose 4,6-dehydratase
MEQRFNALKGKRVFVTGHSGFTGSWACIWLNQIGCEVFGYSLAPETKPNLYTEANVGTLVPGKFADIRDFENLREEVVRFQPDLVLHLAAQPLVRKSYRIPRETFEINAQGTANVLEAIQGVESIKGVLCITTDKVYKNLETDRRYIESDELGGKDPYSASKAAAEIIIASYRASLRDSGSEFPVISVARGGNIIGGGDWSEDRLVPDYIRALDKKTPLEVRYPEATRPWQHVLSLVDGYLSILEGMLSPDFQKYDSAFNLGPQSPEAVTVSDLLELLSRHLPKVHVKTSNVVLPESSKLGLDSSLAARTFGWESSWSTEQMIFETASWYKDYGKDNFSARDLCINQIKSWLNSSTKKNVDVPKNG